MKLHPLKIAASVLLGLLFSAAKAEVVSETLCYAAIGKHQQEVRLLFRKYIDLSIQLEVGAFVRYGTSKNVIPVIYAGDDSSDDGSDYELHWLEVVNKKISGEYTLVKPKNATILGAYMKYESFKTGKAIVFSPAGKSGDDCEAEN